MASARVTITVPQVIADKVKIVAAEQGVSVSSYICKAMIEQMAADTADVLAEYGARREAEEREDRRLSA
ncbi:hypothetical protein [Nocardiopsis chromatogenes]|uniref:hypothetical protein n=1 Tax=Nocardiopsis chromatogenes TaxID=280239 RepID=UPI0012686BFF|nr:hypothetical protein [Nocardiopsis chromatogenes]